MASNLMIGLLNKEKRRIKSRYFFHQVMPYLLVLQFNPLLFEDSTKRRINPDGQADRQADRRIYR